jgi:hypothetical protein
VQRNQLTSRNHTVATISLTPSSMREQACGSSSSSAAAEAAATAVKLQCQKHN